MHEYNDFSNKSGKIEQGLIFVGYFEARFRVWLE